MYKLFYAPESASMGIQAILEEINAPYELISSTIDRNEPSPPEQLAINPNGWVPVLTWNKDTKQINEIDQKNTQAGAMYEFAAIVLYLCDKHPEANLAPAIDNPSRALYLQTLVYFSNSIQNAFQLSYYPDRFVDSPDDEISAQQRGNRRLRETWKVIDDQIGNNTWVLGNQFSAADIYLYMLTTWLTTTSGHPSIEDFPNVKRIAHSTSKRPSLKRVFES